MNFQFRSKRLLYFSIPISLLIIAAGINGIFFKSAYSRETASWAVQGVAQDLANLILTVPALLVSAFLIRKNSIPALFVWLGTSLYILYSFVLYCFALHFNSFFLVYCTVLGLTFYSIISLVISLDLSAVKNWFEENKSNNLASYFLITMAVLFFLVWMKGIVPALAAGEPPQELKENGLLTNPVHVLDLSFLLPGFFISGILLKKKDPLGYLFAPALVTFSIIMALTISGLILAMKLNGLTQNATASIVFVIVALISLLVMTNLMGSLKKYS